MGGLETTHTAKLKSLTRVWLSSELLVKKAPFCGATDGTTEKIRHWMMLHIFNAPRAYPTYYQPYCDDFNFYDGRDVWLKSISSIPPKAIHLFCVHWLHLEVYNGGFWQYFFNSTGTSAPEAAEGFAAIGMPEVSTIVEEAMSKLGNPFPGEKVAREGIVGPPDNRMDFGDLDNEFYELADTEKFFRRLPNFVPFADAYAASPE